MLLSEPFGVILKTFLKRVYIRIKTSASFFLSRDISALTDQPLDTFSIGCWQVASRFISDLFNIKIF